MLRCRTGTRRSGPVRLLSCSTQCCGTARVAYETTSARRSSWGGLRVAVAAALAVAMVSPAAAATAAGSAAQPVFVFGIPVDFILFALTLIGVAIFHHKTLEV